MLRVIKRFRNDQDGAVTVDWVVLTAAITGFGIAIVLTIQGAITDKSAGIGTYVEQRSDLLD